MTKQPVPWIAALLCLICWLRADEVDAAVRFPNGDFAESRTDLQVKVLGGFVEINRTWQIDALVPGAGQQASQKGRWYFNPAWADLDFEYDALDGSVKAVRRAGSRFERSASNSVYIFDKRFFIAKTASGWRWYDRGGNQITYHSDGKIQGYVDRNGVRVTFARDSNGRITQVLDHFGNMALTYQYTDNLLTEITDRGNRSTQYRWENGLLVEVTDPLEHTWKYSYANGLLSEIEDPEGRVQKIQWSSRRVVAVDGPIPGPGDTTTYGYQYDKIKRIWTIERTSPMGIKSIWDYDIRGQAIRSLVGDQNPILLVRDGPNVEITSDQRGLKTRTELDANRRPTKITHPDGTTETRKYEPRFGKISEHIDELGIVTRTSYDEKGNVQDLIEAYGLPEQRQTHFEYDEFGRLTSVNKLGATPAQNALTRYTYDNYGNMLTKTDAEDGLVLYQNHDVMGRAAQVVDARNHTWTMQRNALGWLLTHRNPLGHERSYGYDKVGNPVEIRLPGATVNSPAITTRQYDELNRLIGTRDPLMQEVTSQYDLDGHQLYTEIAAGKRTRFEFDQQGRMFKVTDPNDNVTTTIYGSSSDGLEGLVAERIFPTYRETYRYDTRGRLLSTTRHLGNNTSEQTSTAYDAVGNRIANTDADGKVTQFKYDGLRRMTAIIEQNNVETRYGYDQHDNVVSMTDGNGSTHRFEYDRLSRMRAQIRPMGQVTRTRFDAAGNLIERISPRNLKSVFEYDDANQKIAARYFATENESTPQKQVSFGYDRRGLLKSYNDGTSSGDYGYDALGRKTRESVDYGEFELTHDLEYNAENRLRTLTYPDQSVATFDFTAHGELASVELPGSRSIEYSEYEWSQPGRITYPGGVDRRLTYDALQRLKEINVTGADASTLMHRTINYDGRGAILNVTAEYGATNYSYDAVGHLLAADYPNGPGNDTVNDSFDPDSFPIADDRFTYDALGNRLQDERKSSGAPWQYNANNELIATPEKEFSTNAAGSITSELLEDGGLQFQYEYDLEERLIALRDANGTLLARYYYDPFGRRIAKTTWPGAAGHTEPGPQTTIFAYTDYGYSGVAKVDGDDLATVAAPAQLDIFVFEPGSLFSTNPIAARIDGSWRYYQNDHLLTPQLVLDDAGLVVREQRSSAFGEVVSKGADDLFRFPGQMYDAELNSNYNYFRNYAPELGRYTQADPLGIFGGLNEFSYVTQNPVSAFDPLGLCEVTGEYSEWPHPSGPVTIETCPGMDCITWSWKGPSIQVAASLTMSWSLACEKKCPNCPPKHWSLEGAVDLRGEAPIPIPLPGLCQLVAAAGGKNPYGRGAALACMVWQKAKIVSFVVSVLTPLLSDKVDEAAAAILLAVNPTNWCKVKEPGQVHYLPMMEIIFDSF